MTGFAPAEYFFTLGHLTCDNGRCQKDAPRHHSKKKLFHILPFAWSINASFNRVLSNHTMHCAVLPRPDETGNLLQILCSLICNNLFSLFQEPPK